ncbi:hypothetical protein N7497_010661 [Penicillium chrysogenum]|nr:hypothetical protein N7497_010661 [Penicillium chrysogenum]
MHSGTLSPPRLSCLRIISLLTRKVDCFEPIEERMNTITQTTPIIFELNGTSVSKAVLQFIRYKVD